MTLAFRATFYDGTSSKRHLVEAKLDGETLLIDGEEIDRIRLPLEMIKVAPRVGNTPRFIELTGGARLEVTDNDLVDRLTPSLPGGRFHAFQFRMESRLRWILAMLLLTIGFGWGMINYGVPFAAKQVAFALPREVDESLGSGALAALDELMFDPSTLDEGHRQRLQAGFDDLVAASDMSADRVRLEFRASPKIGANALALPSGIVIMTDELVRLASSDAEVLAVLAHEIGHIRHRHSLRGVLQSSTVALGIATMTGDLGSLTALSATLPTLLVELKYSRAFELEADDYAVDLMNAAKIEPRTLGTILKRLTKGRADDRTGYFSTHPAPSERVERINERMQAE
jgi:Zn-dependent protease with chaperone function